MSETKELKNVCLTPSCTEQVRRLNSRCETCAKERRLTKERTRLGRQLRGTEKAVVDHLADEAKIVLERLEALEAGLEKLRDTANEIDWRVRKTADGAIEAVSKVHEQAENVQQELQLWKERLTS